MYSVRGFVDHSFAGYSQMMFLRKYPIWPLGKTVKAGSSPCRALLVRRRHPNRFLPTAGSHPSIKVALSSPHMQAGEAFVKGEALSMLQEATREHATLQYLHERQPLNFGIPTVLFHTELDGIC